MPIGDLVHENVATSRQIGSSVPVSPLYPYAVFTADGRYVVAADAAATTWVVRVSRERGRPAPVPSRTGT